MKTLKELYWQDVMMSKRMEAKANRKGMVYMALFVNNISNAKYNHEYLDDKLQHEGICKGNRPQTSSVKFDDNSRLIIAHVTKSSKMYEALKNIGFEE